MIMKFNSSRIAENSLLGAAFVIGGTNKSVKIGLEYVSRG